VQQNKEGEILRFAQNDRTVVFFRSLFSLFSLFSLWG
jgi:hypothetical protein